jgi:MFS family permease
LAGILQLAFWTPPQCPGAVVVIGLIAYGFVSGSWISLVPPATAQIGPMKELGMRTGMIWTSSWVGLLAGPVICGRECCRVFSQL